METDTAFVRTDCIVVLNAITHISLDIAFIIHPSYTELINSIRNAQAFNQIYFVEFWVFVVFFFDSA